MFSFYYNDILYNCLVVEGVGNLVNNLFKSYLTSANKQYVQLREP